MALAFSDDIINPDGINAISKRNDNLKTLPFVFFSLSWKHGEKLNELDKEGTINVCIS